jgi:LysR family transcriptional regulator, carnitine catabolism transcriptional activator
MRTGRSLRVNLTLQQLDAFVRVALAGNFRAAAQHLHVSQPALSRTIKIVEAAIGARLFDRDTRHVALTPAGAELLPIAQRILDDFNNAFSDLSQFLAGRSGHVTVASLPSLGVAMLPRAIAAFRGPYPAVQFSLVEGPADALRAAVNDGSVDFAISVRPAPAQSLAFEPLRDDPFVMLCRRDAPMAARAAVPWTAFAGHPFIASSVRSSIRPLTDAAFLQKGMHVVPVLECPSVAGTGGLVAAGLGITALPRLALDLIKPDPQLVAVPLQRPVIVRSIGIVTRIGRSLSPASRAFMDAVRQGLRHG